ncbi:hypothetical protein [Cyclobacterium lianum]|uniref:hypothetical protein n=1 Tax=Cyclobacterium lianum TaxID=388280 RepID=UPI001160D224|nr:hypothetical protein [Cyclobacterium lianum]
MPSTTIKTALLALLCLVLHEAPAQRYAPFEAVWQIRETGIDKIDVDRRGNIFFTTTSGNLKQYSASGDSINYYALPFSSGISRLDAHWTVSIFLFYESQQRFEILDRFLSPLSSQEMADLGLSGFVGHAAPGNNHGIWLYDETDLSLKKINYTDKRLIQEQILNRLIPESSLQITHMVERKNTLFIQVAAEGVYIFDNQANFIKHLALDTDYPVFVENDNIFFLQENKLHRKNFLTGGSLHVELPDKYQYSGLALTGETVVMVHEQGLLAFPRPENF